MVGDGVAPGVVITLCCSGKNELKSSHISLGGAFLHIKGRGVWGRKEKENIHYHFLSQGSSQMLSRRRNTLAYYNLETICTALGIS